MFFPPDSHSCLISFASSLSGKEEKILWKLAHEGPLTAAVDATSWQDYLGGIIQFNCETNRNHAVQIVGYDMTGMFGM
jgi:cathepsin O